MSTELNDAQKQEERVKAQQYADLMGTEYVDPYPAQAPNPTDKIITPVNLDQLTDEQILEAINKRSGGVVLSSLDDLKPKPTEAELEEQRNKRSTDMLTYGLQQGKFKKEDYDAYQLALSNKKGLVREGVAAQLQTAFPELSPEAIEEKVANYLFEHLDETDPMRLEREKEIMTLSDIKIKDKFKNIVNLPKDFEQYEEGILKKTNFENKVKATLPVYQADVTKALESLRTFTVEVPDTKNPANSATITLEFDDADLKEVAEMFLTPDQIVRAVKQGLSFEQIKGEVEFVLAKKHQHRLISQAAKKYNALQKDKYIRGVKGLGPGNADIDISDENLNPSLQDVYEELVASETNKQN